LTVSLTVVEVAGAVLRATTLVADERAMMAAKNAAAAAGRECDGYKMDARPHLFQLECRDLECHLDLRYHELPSEIIE